MADAIQRKVAEEARGVFSGQRHVVADGRAHALHGLAHGALVHAEPKGANAGAYVVEERVGPKCARAKGGAGQIEPR